MSNFNKEINDTSIEKDTLEKELSQICKQNDKFWKEFGLYHSYYYMNKYANTINDVTEDVKFLIEDVDNDKEMKEWFNFCAKDGKNIYDILKAIYHCDFAKATEILNYMDTSPRDCILGKLCDIDKRFREKLIL